MSPDTQTTDKTAAPAQEEDKFSLEGIESKKRGSEYKVYEPPKTMRQLGEIIKLEFRQYFKSPKLIVLYAMAVLVPILQICNVDVIGMFSGIVSIMNGGSALTPLQYLHYCLILMPTVMVLAMAILCGKTISQEYEGKTCFLNLPLPVSRWVFFTGKFIAIAVTCISVMLIGFGFAMIATNTKFGCIAPASVFESLLIGIFTMLALISTGMFFSSICKKRGGLLSLVTIMFIIPLIPIAASLIMNTPDMPSYLDIFLYTPPFSTDAMMIALGWDPTMSLSGFAIGMLYNRAPSVIGSVLASFLWAVALFAAGVVMFNRREV